MSRYGKKKSKSTPSKSAPAQVPAQPSTGPLPPDVLLLTGDQIAALLQVSRKTVDRMAKAGTLPGRIVLGGRVLYHRPTVEGWLAELAKGERHEPGAQGHSPA